MVLFLLTERLAARALRRGIRVGEGEPGVLQADDEINGGALDVRLALGIDEDAYVSLFDDEVGRRGFTYQTHRVFEAGTSAGLHHDAQALDSATLGAGHR